MYKYYYDGKLFETDTKPPGHLMMVGTNCTREVFYLNEKANIKNLFKNALGIGELDTDWDAILVNGEHVPPNDWEKEIDWKLYDTNRNERTIIYTIPIKGKFV